MKGAGYLLKGPPCHTWSVEHCTAQKSCRGTPHSCNKQEKTLPWSAMHGRTTELQQFTWVELKHKLVCSADLQEGKGRSVCPNTGKRDPLWKVCSSSSLDLNLIHAPPVGGAGQSAYIISLLLVSLALFPQPSEVARVRHPLQRTHTQRLHVYLIHRVLKHSCRAQPRPRLNLTLSCTMHISPVLP